MQLGEETREVGEMGSKEEYEARKAERQKLKDLDADVRSKTETLMLMDFVDRFVTATERIADALTPPEGVRR